MKKYILLIILQTITLSVLAQSLNSPSKYFIIQNIATEKTRVYEKCTETPNCPHKMVYETPMIVGRNTDDLKTQLGFYQIEKWVKFYEDGNGKYPSWYDPNYPATPSPGSGFLKWEKSQEMPNGNGEMRGAFGWYTAKVQPNPNGQWMHGTVGWGSDEDRFINRARGWILGMFADLRSHGCTRHENRAIAYLQNLVPAGADFIKIYAKEDFSDQSLSRYENQKDPLSFDFILTKEQVRKENPFTSEASSVSQRLLSGIISENDILEKGNYLANQYPHAQTLNNKRAKSGRSGDSYNIGEGSFHGVFLVDEGRLSQYSHPTDLAVGGYPGIVAPDYMIAH